MISLLFITKEKIRNNQCVGVCVTIYEWMNTHTDNSDALWKGIVGVFNNGISLSLYMYVANVVYRRINVQGYVCFSSELCERLVFYCQSDIAYYA